jgi:flagellar biosynthesis protein FlhB
VALKYNPEEATAPMVLAKGQDYLALRIRELARESGVPVLENPPLARALYKLTPVGREIPPELYVAVAEVLAFVFRLKNRAA